MHRIDQDRFGRSPFAGLVAKTIDAVPVGATSTVFGLVGRWGSGKSSVAAMIAESLPDSWIVQSFTPWAASGATGLQLEFVSALDNALGGQLESELSAREALKRYIDWARPLLSFVPGGGLSDLAGAAGDKVVRRKPWSEEFEAMAASLERVAKRVLIVCDDIDRLDSAELLEFLKVVRLLGRFPNVHYLVAYDADTVEDLLASEGIGGRTSSFMEKIVQHPFELPQISTATRWHHVSASIGRAIEQQGVLLEEHELSRYSLLVDSLTDGLVTPRQIARYEQHLRVLSELVPGEVDLLDFAALAYLRLNHHEVYEALPLWAPQLREGISTKREGDGLTDQEWRSRIEDSTRRVDVSGAWAAVRFLYPGLRAEGAMLHPRAFADERYQERYYSLGVPENDVSDVLIARVMRSLVGTSREAVADSAVASIFGAAQPSVVRIAVRKLREERSRTLRPDDRVADLITFLFARYVEAEPRRAHPDSSADDLLTWLSEEVCRGYSRGEFDRDRMLQVFGEVHALSIFMRAQALQKEGRSLDGATLLLVDVAGHLADGLAAPGAIAGETAETLRLKLSLMASINGHKGLVSILDKNVDGDAAAFELAAVAMVGTTHRFNGNVSIGELEFDMQTWNAVVSPEVRARMTPQLPDDVPAGKPDTLDLSESNRRRFALARVRQDSPEPVPSM
ncbi:MULTISPECIES: KAP family P-loop NTPase fold protein [unclassified Microbacterium]|uniref:KAP family P-loop NTPase fold protein n=1 Tax=unclassified Microbacterium TaxID=2609290 RepID=UPI001444455D|nr:MULTISPECIES: P-loop NTPase fold protein [unclassified Microbacterium]